MNSAAANIRGWALAVAVALVLNADSHAKQFPPVAPLQVGIPSATFNFVASAQQTPVWCWAAAAQMILNYYGIPVTQPQIVTRIFGGPVVTTASDQVISAALNGWGFNMQGRAVTISSAFVPGAPAPTVLINELSQGHPILLAFQSGPYSGHAVVITAATYFPTPQGPQVASMVVRDPFPTPQNVQNLGRVEIGGPALGNFIQTVRAHWLVRVQ
jgi:hypothetical protein